MVSVAVYLEVEANKFKNFRLKFIQLVNAWDILKVPTFLWSFVMDIEWFTIQQFTAFSSEKRGDETEDWAEY